MDTVGILLVIIFAALYFLTRKRETLQGWSKASLVGIGVGLGLIVGAIWVYNILRYSFGAFSG